MELKDTIEMMCSTDYKDRFKAEYYQLKIRYEKLCDILVKYEDKTLEFEPSCDISILKVQAHIMREYLSWLKTRAEVEGIKLYNVSRET